MLLKKRTLIIIGIAIVLIISTFTYFSLSLAGYSVEFYGQLDIGTDWQIDYVNHYDAKTDYSLFPPSTSEDIISAFASDEVIVVLQINNKLFEQKLGTVEDIVNHTAEPMFNIIATHIPTGTYDYEIFLYKNTGIILKSKILKDQYSGKITI